MQATSSHTQTTRTAQARSLPRASSLAWRLLMATAALALAAGLAQTAIAAPGADAHPGGPPHGMMGHEMGGMGGMQGMGDGRHAARMLDAVNATPEQRAQVRQIFEAARNDMKAQHQVGRSLHEQQRSLFAQSTVDARAVEALRLQMMASHDLASKRMTQAMIDVSRVLTADQRKLLSERMAQRRGMMQRHRAEREALEKGKN